MSSKQDSGSGFRSKVANLSEGDTVTVEIVWDGVRHIRGEFTATVKDIKTWTGGPTPDQRTAVIPTDEGELRLTVLEEFGSIVSGPDIELDGRPHPAAELESLEVEA